MARLLLITKILPDGTEINLDELAANIQEKLSGGITMGKYTKEPLAFGPPSMVRGSKVRSSEVRPNEAANRSSGVGMRHYFTNGIAGWTR